MSPIIVGLLASDNCSLRVRDLRNQIVGDFRVNDYDVVIVFAGLAVNRSASP